MRHPAGSSNLSEVRDTLCAMPRKSEFDTRRLNRILQEQHSVISRAQVFSCGMSRSALHLRIASSGPWQRILPGVYLAVTGDRERTAAVAASGQGTPAAWLA